MSEKEEGKRQLKRKVNLSSPIFFASLELVLWMNKLPNMVGGLLKRFGRCEIVRHEYDVPLDQFGMNAKIFYGACVIVKNKEGQFVLVRHRSSLLQAQGPDLWALPCGKLERDESFEEAGVRETLEETGLRVKITGLYRIFEFIQKAPGGESRTESYVAVFFGEAVSERKTIKSPEILEVRKFKKLPRNFAGKLQKYYESLM